jgi:UDP-N-acetylmuramyl pentapeptide phosphotransferase/UDP-N-acetylglucosamine-1-phosphate transferase
MTFNHIAFLFLGTAVASFAMTGLILKYLKRRGIVDTPNERSSHATPTPRGGGLAVIVVLLATWGISLGEGLADFQWLFIATVFIGLISWADDLKSLSASIRLLSQFIAVGLVFWLMPSSLPYFHGFLPSWLDTIVAALAWIWFINLFNFMDGIDGITSVEASAIGFGVFILMMLGAVQLPLGLLGLVTTASALGFLWWNWHPAKLFLGDVGSIPLGFLLGWLLLDILASPLWPVAIILPLYYLADATITLTRRTLRGERVWKAHREHFYQQATVRGLSHAQVSFMIGGANVVLIGLAVFSLLKPWLALLGAVMIVGVLLLILRGFGNKKTP